MKLVRSALLSLLLLLRRGIAESALMLIDPSPWSAPLEDVRLKK